MDKSHLTLGVQRCVQTDKVFALLRAIKAQCCPSLQIMTLNTQGPGIERLQNVAIRSRRKELRNLWSSWEKITAEFWLNQNHIPYPICKVGSFILLVINRQRLWTRALPTVSKATLCRAHPIQVLKIKAFFFFSQLSWPTAQEPCGSEWKAIGKCHSLRESSFAHQEKVLKKENVITGTGRSMRWARIKFYIVS